MSVLISALIAQAWSCAIREWIPVGSKHRKIHMAVGSFWEFAPCPGMFSCIWKFITLFHNCTSFCLVCVTPPANSWGPIKDGGDSVCVCVQVDELYEAFCIQSRLREGAIRMKQAFSSSPSTKGTKESIAEVNRRYKEYTEVLRAVSCRLLVL